MNISEDGMRLCDAQDCGLLARMKVFDTCDNRWYFGCGLHIEKVIDFAERIGISRTGKSLLNLTLVERYPDDRAPKGEGSE